MSKAKIAVVVFFILLAFGGFGLLTYWKVKAMIRVGLFVLVIVIGVAYLAKRKYFPKNKK